MREEKREAVKRLMKLKIIPEWRILKVLYLLLKHLEQIKPNQTLTKSLGELEDEINPLDFVAFEKSLYLLARHGFIKVTAPSSVAERPRSILHGKIWKPIRRRLSERGRTPKSAGEILLYYLYATRKDHLRQRRRRELREILTFHIAPMKLQKLKEILQNKVNL